MDRRKVAIAKALAKCGKDKIAEAKNRLREVLNFEEVKRLLKGRIFNIDQYNEYMNSLERFIFLILESFMRKKKTNP